VALFGDKNMSSSRSRSVSKRVNNATFGTHTQGPAFDVSKMDAYSGKEKKPTVRRTTDGGASHAVKQPSQRSTAQTSSRQASQSTQQTSSKTQSQVVPQVHTAPSSHRAHANQSKTSRAKKGYISQISPNTATKESGSAYSRRMNKHKQFAQGEEIRTKRNRILVVVLTAVIALAAAFLVGNFVFNKTVNSKMSFPADSGVAAALSTPTSGEPYYVLLTANIDAQITSSATTDSKALGGMLLARVDEENKKLTVLTIQKDIRVAYNGEYTSAAILYENEGEGALVSAMATFLDVPIAHCIHIQSKGFCELIDELGGVTLNVPEEIDDPTAGSIYIPQGEQTLDSSASCVLLRAKNYQAGTETQMQMQQLFVSALAQLFFTDSGFSIGTNLDNYASYISTDLSAADLKSIFDKFSGITSEEIYTASFDGYDTTTSDGSNDLFVADSSYVTSLMEKVEAGEKPEVTVEDNSADVDKESFEITVKNGGGIDGSATQVANILKDAGFQVAEVTNADSYVYTETLVVYLDDEYETAAKSVLSEIGMGRVIDGTNFYILDTEVLVIVGSDWKPLN
jgi:polyisoprenyl-teichoic acid--peptidoglycan teichoic acid transferase